MAPLRDAVRLVDGNARDGQPAHFLAEPVQLQSFRGHIQQLDLAAASRPDAVVHFLARQRTVDVGRRDAHRRERIHLVLHQRDQRRHDQR
ncbi:hypothetical protein D3C81_1210410 [compost metagenome]